MKNCISVIIPVYNVAAYLPQCLDSVLSQDHRELEVILIDDGSTDDSGAICDRYAQRDNRVKVIHQKNSGAAAAKNAGLRIATGEYLSFVDSDDYLEPDVYGYMLSALKQTGADAIHCNFREVYQNRTEECLVHKGRALVSSREYLRRFPKDWSCPLLWNKLYKRSLFDGVFFEEGHKIDDEYFTYQGFLGECTILCDEKVIYNYRKRRSSVMSRPEAATQRLMDTMDSVAKRRKKVLAVFPELRREYDENYLDAIWYLSENYGMTEDTIRDLKRLLDGYLLEWGNSFPPRFLWMRLLKFRFTSSKKRVQQCNARKEKVNSEGYFQ